MIGTIMKRGVLAAAMLGVVTGTALAAKEVKVSIGVGAKHPTVSHGWEPYVKAVEEATGGSLKFRLFLSGSLLPLKATMTGVRDGVADVGLMVLHYYPAELPHSNLIGDLALLGTDNAVMAGATTEFNLFQCSECLSEFAAQRQVYLGAYASTPFRVISKGKITTLDDLKGKKVRISGAAWTRWLANFNAVPVPMPADEMFEGLSQGVINGAIQSPGALRSYSLWDVADSITMIPLGTAHSVSLMGFSQAFWRNLTLAERTALIDKAALNITGTVMQYEKLDQDVLKVAGEHGVTIHEASPELTAASMAFAEKDLATVAKESEENYKIENARAKIDAFVALVRKWEKLAVPVRNDPAKLEALYKREIFDKLDRKTFGM